MLKKDVDELRRNIKLDNVRLTFKEIMNLYVIKETDKVYFKQKTSFSLLEKEEQELFLYNFRKALTGQIDQKLFPLRFTEDGAGMKTLLYENLTKSGEQWESTMEMLVEKMLEEEQYESDIVITFVRGDYGTVVKGTEGNETYVNPFMLCTINETKMPNNEMVFDYVEKEFTYHIEVNPAIDLKSPVRAFLFPTFEYGSANVNQLLYTTRKAFHLDENLLNNVLQVEMAPTAEDDKVVFNEIVNRVAGNQLSTKKLSQLYEGINERIDEDETVEVRTLDYRDIDEVLTASGINPVGESDVKEVFEQVTNNINYELKAENVIPKFTTKSLKIKTKVANFSLRPQDLQYVRQVNIDGKLCLVIELDESTEIDGFSLIPEANLTEQRNKHE